MARILAFGAFLKNTACLLDTDAPDAVRWSAVHGDLSDPAACMALSDSAGMLLADGQPIDAVAHDLHPDFFSTHIALQVAQQQAVPAIAVQHHHAHIAAVMADHALPPPLLGLALDGVGLGSDGQVWGGEVLLIDDAGFERLGHLLPLALPGGDVAAREPWRMAAAALHACGRADQIVARFGPVVGQQAAQTIHTMLQRGLNCFASSAAGRWFDAAAGLLGLSVKQAFEAQAAMLLEQAAARWLVKAASLDVGFDDWCVHPDGQIDLRPLLNVWLMEDDASDADRVDERAAQFHLTLAAALATHAIRIAKVRNLGAVALGGGCFFNRILKLALAGESGRQNWFPPAMPVWRWGRPGSRRASCNAFQASSFLIRSLSLCA